MFRKIIIYLLQKRNGEARHNNADHRHELDEDVERGPRGVFKWVAHGVAHDGGLVVLATLTLKVAFFNHLLGIVPGSA